MPASAQHKAYTQRPAIGIHAIAFDFTGADTLRAFAKNVKSGLAISYQNNISPQWDISTTISGTFLNFPARDGHSLSKEEERLLIESTISARARLLQPKHRMTPFVQAGIGLSQFNNYYGLFVPTGAGLQITISPDVLLLINTQYRLPLTATQNNHFYHSIGMAGVIGKKKINQRKPLPPLPAKTLIITDTDGDGIVDSIDACSQVPGFIKYHGCPIPDTDKDGINDEQDKCPEMPGLIYLHGCPLPDRDKDGIADEQDKCPDLPGAGTATGCPKVADSLNNRLQKAAHNIFFETGKFTLLPASYAALQEVVQIMQQDQHLRLTIEGHTDAIGKPQDNKLLSENRVRTVFNYLVEKGIAAQRISSIGYGAEQPVAGNNTLAGRAANRRVVFILRY